MALGSGPDVAYALPSGPGERVLEGATERRNLADSLGGCIGAAV